MSRGYKMTQEGILAYLDSLGRVVIPKPMRTRMGITPRSCVVVSQDSSGRITIEKYAPEYDLKNTLETLTTQLEGLHRVEVLSNETFNDLMAGVVALQKQLNQLGSADSDGQAVSTAASTNESL